MSSNRTMERARGFACTLSGRGNPTLRALSFYRIDGKVYTPIPMSQTNGKCIALRAQGDFIGKEVEFVD